MISKIVPRKVSASETLGAGDGVAFAGCETAGVGDTNNSVRDKEPSGLYVVATIPERTICGGSDCRASAINPLFAVTSTVIDAPSAPLIEKPWITCGPDHESDKLARETCPRTNGDTNPTAILRPNDPERIVGKNAMSTPRKTMPPASANKLLRSHLRRISGFMWVGDSIDRRTIYRGSHSPQRKH